METSLKVLLCYPDFSFFISTQRPGRAGVLQMKLSNKKKINQSINFLCFKVLQIFGRFTFSGQVLQKNKSLLWSHLMQTLSIVIPAFTYSTVIKIIQNSISCPVNCVSTLHSLFVLFQPPTAHYCKHGLLRIEWCYILMIHRRKKPNISCMYVFEGWSLNLQGHIVAERAVCLLATAWCQSALTLFSCWALEET